MWVKLETQNLELLTNILDSSFVVEVSDCEMDLSELDSIDCNEWGILQHEFIPEEDWKADTGWSVHRSSSISLSSQGSPKLSMLAKYDFLLKSVEKWWNKYWKEWEKKKCIK